MSSGMSSGKIPRIIKTDGPHAEEVLNVLRKELGVDGTAKAVAKAKRILELSVDPTQGKPSQPSDGLLYGLIQSGKTSILTLAAGMAVDNFFDCILVLTSDNNPLYEQTTERIRAALGGLRVLGKNEWKDTARFAKQMKAKPFAIACSKNGNMLSSLLEAFKKAKSKSLSVLIVDDEADQASLNTYTSKQSSEVSTVNRVITELRAYFPINTYLQVTATPQALFLQRPDHRYRPSFTVLTEPGDGYVGGESFFSEDTKLRRIVDLAETAQLTASNQPTSRGNLPTGLKRAICTYFVAAAARLIQGSTENYAFLLHVSMGTKDHEYTRQLIDDFKQDAFDALKKKKGSTYTALIKELHAAYDDLKATEPSLPAFAAILGKIEFYLNGATTKLINAMSSDEVKLDSKFNLFVGGNKLGRGVTIRNLLVSYYGRNPKRPKADTVLQHARMYGYRKKDLGVTRLYLPQRLADHFTAIHRMERSLRDLVQTVPDGAFEGLYISGAWDATRKNVTDPDSLGSYSAGGSINPRYPERTVKSLENTKWLDAKLQGLKEGAPYSTITVAETVEILKHTPPDPTVLTQLWDMRAIDAALKILKGMKTPQGKPIYGDKVYLVVKRGLNQKAHRSETQGIITGGKGGDESLAPKDAPTLFMYKMNQAGPELPVWWPQLRFPDGAYLLSFSFDW
ncbi:MAG: hypothetical protein JWQ42_2774 [Edaphobacter sp.]|nr:hypothetical protein [Edaphobacter sp.]